MENLKEEGKGKKMEIDDQAREAREKRNEIFAVVSCCRQ